MIRLYVVVEGQTEEQFVKMVLGPHLAHHGVFAFASIVGTPKKRGNAPLHKGGGDWNRWERDIRRVLGEQHRADARVTTLFDLYELPKGFPGLAEGAAWADTAARCDGLQRALGEHFAAHRHFIPYLQRHEFEALVLAALPSLRELLDAEDDIAGLAKLESTIAGHSPEEVNDAPETAPSKRLLNHVPSYRKLLHGPMAIELAGLAAIRLQCPRFDAWVARLEDLNSNQ